MQIVGKVGLLSKVRRDVVIVADEIGLGDHEGVAYATKVSSIFDFLGECVADVDFAGNMGHHGVVAVLDNIADFVFVEIGVLGAFVGNGGRPVNFCLVVVELLQYIFHYELVL